VLLCKLPSQRYLHFTRDRSFVASDSTTRTYITIKHTTSLTLTISPTSVALGRKYSVSGTLTDASTSTPLGGETIKFTSSPPITISSKITNTLGKYSATGLIAPRTAGAYHITAHFIGTALYKSANSPVKTLTVNGAAVTTGTPTTGSPPNTTITTTPQTVS
jgi:hypothetical protein